MDQDYVQHLFRARQTLEIWLLNRGQKSLLIGTCEFPLAVLAANELPGVKRPATVEERLMVRPSAELVGQQRPRQEPIGHLRIKMRLREPISAAFQTLRVSEQVT